MGSWKRLGKHRRTWRIIFNIVQNLKKWHPAGWENTQYLP